MKDKENTFNETKLKLSVFGSLKSALFLNKLIQIIPFSASLSG